MSWENVITWTECRESGIIGEKTKIKNVSSEVDYVRVILDVDSREQLKFKVKIFEIFSGWWQGENLLTDPFHVRLTINIFCFCQIELRNP